MCKPEYISEHVIGDETFYSLHSIDSAANALKFNPSDFAKSLRGKVASCVGMSSIQVAWIHKLAMRVGVPGFESARDFLLNSAVESPRLKFKLDNITLTVRLNRSKSNNVTCDMRRDGMKAGFCVITPGGVATKFMDASKLFLEAIARFNENPGAFAAENGRRTGTCCFCSRLLTESRSVEVGYGPVCAEKYNLPW